MKTILFAIFISILFCACNPSESAEQLRKVESLMRDQPDSALILIKGMDFAQLRGEYEKALYALLLTEARYKNRMTDTDDSLINIAIKYFEGHPNDINRIKSHFYAGQIYFNRADYSKAIVSFLNAESAASEMKDSLQLGLIYRALGDSYDILSVQSMALKYFRESLNIFKSINAERYINYAYYDLSRAYHNNYDYDNSILNTKKAFELISEKNDSSLMCKLLWMEISDYVILKNFNSADSVYRYFINNNFNYELTSKDDAA